MCFLAKYVLYFHPISLNVTIDSLNKLFSTLLPNRKPDTVLETLLGDLCYYDLGNGFIF